MFWKKGEVNGLKNDRKQKKDQKHEEPKDEQNKQAKEICIDKIAFTPRK